MELGSVIYPHTWSSVMGPTGTGKSSVSLNLSEDDYGFLQLDSSLKQQPELHLSKSAILCHLALKRFMLSVVPTPIIVDETSFFWTHLDSMIQAGRILTSSMILRSG